MLKQVAVLTAAVVLGALLTVALLDRPASAQAAGEAAGKVQVVAGAGGFVMYDLNGTATWIVIPQAGEKKFAWFPIKRLDTDAAVQMWRTGRGE